MNRPHIMNNSMRAIVLSCLVSAAYCLVSFSPCHGQEDAVKYIEQKRAELQEREAAIKREEERIAAMRREADQRIDKYTKLLAKIEDALKRLEQAKTERMQAVVKVYESMPAEEAAARLSALDEETALVIIKGMKSKKAGAVMSFMEPRKAAELTRAMASLDEEE